MHRSGIADDRGENEGEEMIITIDPTELQPGDIVISISDHDISGCHCDVRVTVKREHNGNH